MENEPLSSAEKKELRGISQRLKPKIHIGKQGLSETVLAEIETALTKNGLIKIRFEADRVAIQAYCADIPAKLMRKNTLVALARWAFSSATGMGKHCLSFKKRLARIRLA